MTWEWNTFKFIVSTALSVASTLNPAFFLTAPAGEGLAEIIKSENYKTLNSSTESFDNKEKSLRAIELTKDYQVDTAIGGAFSAVGEVVGTLGPMITKELGHEVAVELASHGGWTQTARQLRTLGHWISKGETGVKWSNRAINFASEAKNEIAEAKKHGKRIDEILILVRTYENSVDTLQGDWEALKKMREYFLQLNIENIGLYIDKEEDITKHQQVNQIINDCLSSIREFQREMHESNQCVASECRFSHE